MDFAFSPSQLSAPANTPFRLVFSNADAAIQHNVVIRTGAGAQVYSGKIITGVSKVTYTIPALAAGEYGLACIVHPDMSGSLAVH